MNDEPRYEADYSDRQIDAARRVLIDVGQVLASFADCLVLVGGWVPDLLIPEAGESHIGSIDVDLAWILAFEGHTPARVGAAQQLPRRLFHGSSHDRRAGRILDSERKRSYRTRAKRRRKHQHSGEREHAKQRFGQQRPHTIDLGTF